MSNASRPNLPPFLFSRDTSGLLKYVTSLSSPLGVGDLGLAVIEQNEMKGT